MRSSASIEDGNHNSFAGQFRTVVDVTESSLVEAVEQVLNQAHEFLNGDLSRFSVIVQKYIHPEISGVTFTRNPLGSREMVIETHRGRGEDLVSGKVRPSKVSFHRGQKISSDELGGIPSAEKLVPIFDSLESDFGFPQDIEWCVGDGGFYLLQSRPITTLTSAQFEGFRYLDQHLPRSSRFLFEKTELAEVAPNPTPVTFSLMEKIYDDAGPCSQVYRKYGISYRRQDMMKLIGTQLFIDREQELKTLFPNFTHFKGSSLKPAWAWSSGMFVSTRNSLAFGLLFSKANQNSLSLLEKSVREKAAASNEDAFHVRLGSFLEDYKTLFEINLLAAAAAKRVEYLLVKEPVSSASLSRARTVFLYPSELRPLVVTLPLKGNCLDIADESEYASHHSSADDSASNDPQVAQWWASLGKMKQVGLKAPLAAWLRLEHLREMARTLTVLHVNRMRDALLKEAEMSGFRDLRSVYFARISEILTKNISEAECLKRRSEYHSLNHLVFQPRLSDRIWESKSESQCVSTGVAEGVLISWQQYKAEIASRPLEQNKYVIYTDSLYPEIAPHFGSVVAVLAQTGGLLSHLAIVARERGVPVITQYNLPSEFKIGDYVSVLVDPLGKVKVTNVDTNTKSPTTAHAVEMKRQFLSTFANLTSKSVDGLYEEVAAKYSEAHRRYHNLTHISECLAELQTIKLSNEDRVAIELSVWFHDVVYDPKSKTNEEDSAKYFSESGTALGIDDKLKNRVTAYILATKRHEAGAAHDLALSYFLDIDLAILGSNAQRFEEYDAAIRTEFSWVPGIIYGPKRKKILRSFLERENLFLTPEFRDRYEPRARENLRKLIGN